jgi:hypothetical protein
LKLMISISDGVEKFCLLAWLIFEL